jgi:hypothetical protein
MGFDVDLESGFWLVDWSGSEVNLALGAPDLYLIRNKAGESVHDTNPIGNSNGSTVDSLSGK